MPNPFPLPGQIPDTQYPSPVPAPGQAGSRMDKVFQLLQSPQILAVIGQLLSNKAGPYAGQQFTQQFAGMQQQGFAQQQMEEERRQKRIEESRKAMADLLAQKKFESEDAHRKALEKSMADKASIDQQEMTPTPIDMATGKVGLGALNLSNPMNPVPALNPMQYVPQKQATAESARVRDDLRAEKQFALSQKQAGEMERHHKALEDKPATEKTPQKVGEFDGFPVMVVPGDNRQYVPTPKGAVYLTDEQLKSKKYTSTQEQQKILVSMRIGGLTATPGGDESVEAQARSVLAGNMAPSQIPAGMRGTNAIRVKAKILELDPNFDFQRSESGYKFGSSTGTQQRARSVENVEISLGVLDELSKKVKRSGIKIVNRPLLATLEAAGDPDVAAYQAAANVIADELGQVFQGGTGSATSDMKIKLAQKILDQNLTPSQFDATLKTVKDLLAVRRKTLTSGTFMNREGGKSDPEAKAGETHIYYDKSGKRSKK